MDLPALFAACRSPADYYRVQIAAENLLAPAEIEALDPAALPEAAQEWRTRLLAMLRMAGAGGAPFGRRALAEHATLYETEAVPGADRALVVGFAGVAQRMNLPAAAFLQALEAGGCDVVILRDGTGIGFLAGVPGYAPDLPALAARLAEDLPAARYPGGIRCIGTSAGGAAALYFAVIAGARRGLSVDGAHPASMALRAAGTLDRHVFEGALAGRDARGTALIAAHGVGAARDAVRSRLLALGLPGTRALPVAVEGPHGLLAPLLMRRLLGPFLTELLLADTEPAALPAAWPAAAVTPADARDCPG